MKVKVISRGTKKNGQKTAQIIVNGQTKHLVYSRYLESYIDREGTAYNIG